MEGWELGVGCAGHGSRGYWKGRNSLGTPLFCIAHDIHTQYIMRPRRMRVVSVVPSRPKRKHNFELIIEIPAKKLKASYRPTSNPSPSGPLASSSQVTLDNSAGVATRTPVKETENRPWIEEIGCKVLGVTFKVGLNPEIRDLVVTRSFMASHFGAHPRRQISQLSEEWVRKHGYDHFVFLHAVRTSKKICFMFSDLR